MKYLTLLILSFFIAAPVAAACEGFEQDMAALENIVHSTPPRVQQPAVTMAPAPTYTVCEKDNCLEVHKPLELRGTYAPPATQNSTPTG